jgi:type I site-specific restriction-modification system R (restriction) subunit
MARRPPTGRPAQLLLRQPNRTLLGANEAIQALLFKAQVDVNEATGEADPLVQLIDFAHPENNTFHAINQFRIDTPGCVKAFIIPDIVLLVNGIPLCVVECKWARRVFARTNRVSRGKKRGDVVDYIGLANHLTEALTIYAASDELEELQSGLQNISTELPVLEERYQRLLQHFEALGVKQIKPFVNGDPAFFKSLSAKVDALIEKHHDHWDLLADQLAELRAEAVAGRTQGDCGMGREATTFYEHIVQVGFANGVVPESDRPALKTLMGKLVEVLQETIGSLDFWMNADQQKRVRGAIKTEISMAGIEELKTHRERVTVEVMKLAKNRHDTLLRGNTTKEA